MLPTCPTCSSELSIDEDDEFKTEWQAGDITTCPDCNSELEISETEPVTFAQSDKNQEFLGCLDCGAIFAENDRGLASNGIRRPECPECGEEIDVIDGVEQGDE